MRGICQERDSMKYWTKGTWAPTVTLLWICSNFPRLEIDLSEINGLAGVAVLNTLSGFFRQLCWRGWAGTQRGKKVVQVLSMLRHTSRILTACDVCYDKRSAIILGKKEIICRSLQSEWHNAGVSCCDSFIKIVRLPWQVCSNRMRRDTRVCQVTNLLQIWCSASMLPQGVCH